MVFHYVNDGFSNSMHWMKDWHEMTLEHGAICKKMAHELKKHKFVCTHPPFKFSLLKCASYHNCVKE
jgi:hypothetical protein